MLSAVLTRLPNKTQGCHVLLNILADSDLMSDDLVSELRE